MTTHSGGGTPMTDIRKFRKGDLYDPLTRAGRLYVSSDTELVEAAFCAALERELAAARSALAEEERKLELANQVNGQLSNTLSVKHHLLEAAEARAGEAEKERELELMKEALKLKGD